MIEKGLYYAKDEFYEMIRSLGGKWNDPKRRPLVCLIESSEQKGLYWAIPMGSLNHRDERAQQRIQKFLSYDDTDLRSCYYHIGRTTEQSIFLISNAIPITDKYIDASYLGRDNNHFVIKNKPLLLELERKLSRILSFENSKANYFPQQITNIKAYLIKELTEQDAISEVAATAETDGTSV